jgi:flagellar hook-length control protein FliK
MVRQLSRTSLLVDVATVSAVNPTAPAAAAVTSGTIDALFGALLEQMRAMADPNATGVAASPFASTASNTAGSTAASGSAMPITNFAAATMIAAAVPSDAPTTGSAAPPVNMAAPAPTTGVGSAAPPAVDGLAGNTNAVASTGSEPVFPTNRPTAASAPTVPSINPVVTDLAKTTADGTDARDTVAANDQTVDLSALQLLAQASAHAAAPTNANSTSAVTPAPTSDTSAAEKSDDDTDDSAPVTTQPDVVAVFNPAAPAPIANAPAIQTTNTAIADIASTPANTGRAAMAPAEAAPQPDQPPESADPTAPQPEQSTPQTDQQGAPQAPQPQRAQQPEASASQTAALTAAETLVAARAAPPTAPKAEPKTEPKADPSDPKLKVASKTNADQTATATPPSASSSSQSPAQPSDQPADQSFTAPPATTAHPTPAAHTGQPHVATHTAPPQPANPDAALTPPATQSASNLGADVQVSAHHHTGDTPTAFDKLGLTIAAKSAQGLHQFDIRLDPAELGRVDVQLTVDSSGQAQANLVVDNPKTLELLQRDASSLNRALSDAGLNLSGGGLNFSLREQQRDAGGSNPQRSRGRGLSVNAAIGANTNRSPSGSYAPNSVRLDIRV